MRYFKRKEAPQVDGNDLLHISLDITVQQRFGMSVGRLVFAFTCCYYQADDCNHNHKHLIVAHEHHLPHPSFEESGRKPLPISIYEYARSSRPPFHGSAKSIITHALQLIKSLGQCLISHFTNTSYSFYSCYKKHTCYNSTDSLLIQPRSPCSPCLQTHHTHQAHLRYKTLTISKRRSKNSAFWDVQSVMCV